MFATRCAVARFPYVWRNLWVAYPQGRPRPEAQIVMAPLYASQQQPLLFLIGLRGIYGKRALNTTSDHAADAARHVLLQDLDSAKTFYFFFEVWLVALRPMYSG